MIYQYASPFAHSIHKRMNYFSLLVILTTITFEMVGDLRGNIKFIDMLSRIMIVGSNSSFYAICILMILRIIYKNAKDDLTIKKFKQKIKASKISFFVSLAQEYISYYFS